MGINTTLDYDTNTRGCGCPICMKGGDAQADLKIFNEGFDTIQSNAPTTAATKEQFADYLINGYWADVGFRAHKWYQSNVTYSLSSEFSTSEKNGFRMAFDQWADVTNLTFSEVFSGADIIILEGDDFSAYSQPFVYIGTDQLALSIISIDASSGFFGSNIGEIGNYGLLTATHEIGHSLGLGHSGNYNGTATYETDAMWTNDTRQYSLMSYFQASKSGADHTHIEGIYNVTEYAATPLLFDIYAIQQIYGANMSTRNTDTVYGFNSTAGRDQFDFTLTPFPVAAIWDGGGTDTLDLSGFTNTQVIDLRQGAFSNVAGLTGNIAIAYGAVIENAKGGSGQDTFYGNDSDNILLGNAGNDYFFASLGNDEIDGGADTDTLEYSYDLSEFIGTVINAASMTLNNIVQGFVDTLSNLEMVIFNAVSYSWSQLVAQFGTIYGTSGDDNPLNGTPYDDTIKARAGNDVVYGLDGDDLLRGEEGNDTLYGGLGDDDLRGEDGDDTLYGNEDHDILYGGVGMDYLDGGLGDDRLYGMEDNDELHGGAGNDMLFGGKSSNDIYASDDLIYGDAGNDSIYGRKGNDTAYGGDDDDTIYGEQGDDNLYGDAGVDILRGGSGMDYLDGGLGDDRLYGMEDNDELHGGDGNDRLYGGYYASDAYASNDVLYGDAGNDKLYGRKGNDILYGGTDDDTLYGEEGNDTLYGEDGADILKGGDGNDNIIGGAGVDTLYGQGDADTFVFDAFALDGSIDVIKDFSLLEGDNLDVSDILIGYNPLTDAISDFIQITESSAHSFLHVDVDGGADNFVQIAQIRNTSGLTDEEALETGGTLITV
ncbi:MAG: M10 family metallopeptidase C-terminal domain-containing protein [Rhodospirillales bacterium]|nr:M10 family metallopeptidase C-terminal domain-containing protein [Rhodospirillales bacterium]